MIAAVCASVFAALTVAVILHPEPFAVDRGALRAVEGLRAPWLTTVLAGISVLGSSPGLLAIALAVGAAALLLRRDLLPGAWLLTAYLGAALQYQSLKALLDRGRPPGGLVEAAGSAFPSGHATQGIAFFGTLAALLLTLLPRRVGVFAAVAAVTLGVLSGVSRVYLGVHWLTDVMGGFLLGGAWLAIVLAVRARVARRATRATDTSPRTSDGARSTATRRVAPRGQRTDGRRNHE